MAATIVCVAVVAGCALLVAGMGSAGSGTSAPDTPLALPSFSPSTYAAPSWSSTTSASALGPAGPTEGTGGGASTSASSATSTSSVATAQNLPTVTVRPTAVRPPPSAIRSTTTSTSPPPVRGQALPVAGSTSGATRVITVLALNHSSTTATLQAWDRAPGGGWLTHGGAIVAHVGSQGLTTAPSETLSATPIGSFTLTQAFGSNPNPGTGLPYFRTTSADWWISESGPLYNTHQHCSSGCRFDTAISNSNPNEHLYYEQPYYREAVVIDYNTANSSTGVQQGRGSAFFLHVTDGTATAGCVAIPESNLISIMQWLTPAARPRILIGTAH